MKKEKMERLRALLRRGGMYAPEIDILTLCNAILAQLRISSYGGESSVALLPTNLPATAPPSKGEPLALVLIDRRMLRCALAEFGEGGSSLTMGETFETPGAHYPATLAELMFAAAELAEPLLARAKGLYLVLDLPLLALPEGDAALCALPPSLQLHDWEGRAILPLLRAELAARGFAEHSAGVGSLVSAALLAGLAAERDKGRHLALHWGEGLRAAFAAPKSAVVKLKSGEKSLLVFEAGLGGFSGVPFGRADLAADRDSARPGCELLEKMLSTEQLGEQFRFTIIQAVEERLLTFMCGRDFLSLRKLSLSALLQFLTEPVGEGKIAGFCSYDTEDREVALAVANAVADRAARLAAAGLLATALLIGAGRGAHMPARISLSGRALDAPILRRKFLEQLGAAGREMGLNLRILEQEDAALCGAAAAALLSKG